MKQIFYVVFAVVLLFTACRNNGGSDKNVSWNNPSDNNTAENGTIMDKNNPAVVGGDKNGLVGGDKDAHGCIASAGYTWCEVQGRCVRLWEDGVKLEPVEKSINSGDATFNVFILFSTDSLKVELFDARLKEPLILNLTDKNGKAYYLGKYQVERTNGKWVVKNDGKPDSVEL